MRHGWDYKKLGDVCTIERGGSPRPITDYITDSPDGVNWIKIGDAKEGSKYITSTKEKIKKEGIKKSRYVHKGDFILSKSMSFGRLYILDVDGCIHDGWLVIHDDNNVFIKDYLYYLLASPVMYAKFKQLAVGGVVNNLNSALVRKVEIPIPNMTTQEVIVKELDKINKLISLKKQQLADYESLSKSIFFEMFGDPRSNPKGFEIRTMDSICENMTKGPFGSDIKKDLYVPKSSDTYKVYIQINAIAKDHTLGEYYISKEYFDSKMRRFEVKPGDYIITCDGTLGKFIRLPETIEKGIISASLLRLTLNENVTCKYFEYLWETYVLGELVKDTRNTALIHLPAASKIGKVLIPLPQFELQVLFSNRINKIENIKSQIQKSIQDLETLLASRMQYWFD